jgi:hypothetical protein
MAGTLSYTINIQWQGEGKTMTIPAVTASRETGLEVLAHIQSIRTDSTQLVAGDVDDPVAGYFRNLDADNFVTLTDGEDGDVLAIIPAGQNQFVHIDPTQSLWAKADTAALLLDYTLYNQPTA